MAGRPVQFRLPQPNSAELLLESIQACVGEERVTYHHETIARLQKAEIVLGKTKRKSKKLNQV
jgi:hypothetical protein